MSLIHIAEVISMIPTFTVRTVGNYDADALSKETGLFCEDPSRAVQSQKDEADINTIVKNFGVTGQLPQNVRAPSYGDFDGVSDYREALEAMHLADASFMAMPAKVRAEFDNDPALFVDFCSDPANLPRMRELGLAVPLAEPAAPASSPSG